MDFIRAAASQAVQSARKSAKHAIEIASMANTAARTALDHISASKAVGSATGAVDEMHAATAMHDIAQEALQNGDHEQAVQASIASLEASKNVARLSLNAAINASDAGAPAKVVDLVANHARQAHNEANANHRNMINKLQSWTIFQQ